jgi:hypothetical protein
MSIEKSLEGAVWPAEWSGSGGAGGGLENSGDGFKPILPL